MASDKKTIIEPISKNSFLAFNQDISQTSEKKPSIDRLTRLSVDAYPKLAEELKDYSYWRGMTQKEAVIHILEAYFHENMPKKRPEEVRERAEQRKQRRSKRKGVNNRNEPQSRSSY